MKIRVGTRGSRLAMIQAKSIARILEDGGFETELIVVSTKGDLCQKLPIDKVGKNGVFVGELESALVAGQVDIAVHSLKDMSSKLPEGFCLAPPPTSPDVRDVVIAKKKPIDESDLALMTIATGSNRRKAQLLHYYPSIQIEAIRGNIQTRIQKMQDMNVDGTILAYAGLKRAGLTDAISCYLDPTRFIPSPCQGLLGIEVSETRKDLLRILEDASDPYACFRMAVERRFQRTLGASCHSPIGIYIERRVDSVILHGCFSHKWEEPLHFATVKTTMEHAKDDVLKLAQKVKAHE